MSRNLRILSSAVAIAALLTGLAAAPAVGSVPQSSPAGDLPQRITLVRLTDLNGDGAPEVLIGMAPTGDSWLSTLSIYTAKGGQFSLAGTRQYADLSVTDLDADGHSELIVLGEAPRGEMDPPASALSVLRVVDGVLTEIGQTRLEGWPLAISTGPAAAGKLGIFVELCVGAHSSITELMFWGDGHLNRAFADSYEVSFKPYPLYSEDINSDGIVELGMQLEPYGSDYPMYQIPWIETWQQWDGRGGLGPVAAETFCQFDMGFRFAVPEAWRGKYTTLRADNGDLPGFRFIYTGADRTQSAPLLTFRQYRPIDWAVEATALARTGAEYEVLQVRDGVVTMVIFPTASEASVSAGLLNEYRGLLLDAAGLEALVKLR